MIVSLLPVADALARVLEGASPLGVESVPVAQATGRVLAKDLRALRTQPPQDVSAMDGYAVRAADVESAPASLKVIGEVAAGRPFAGEIKPGEALRIFTGGVMPRGADTVVIQEVTVRDGDRVSINAPASLGQHVRKKGLDFNEGDVLLARDRRLTARDAALAAALNHPALDVFRRPRIAVMSTGDELVPPGSVLRPGQIVSSNGLALSALCAGEGAEAHDFGIVADTMEATIAAIRRARDWGADVLVTSGGASVGDYDLIQPALAAEGLALSFWKVAVRPGKPLLSGRLGDMRVLGVPGNPVSAFVCGVLFLTPLIRALSGRTDIVPARETATLGRDLAANDEREDYLRATLSCDGEGLLVATPFPLQDSSMMAPLARADCLLVREPRAPAAKAGSRCAILKLPL